MEKVITHGSKTVIYDADVVNLFLDHNAYEEGQFITSFNVRGSLSIERVNRVIPGEQAGVLNVYIA